jgi:hypothetical protein
MKRAVYILAEMGVDRRGAHAINFFCGLTRFFIRWDEAFDG